MSDKLWQQICMYILNDILAIMGPFTHQSMDHVPIKMRYELRQSQVACEIPCVFVAPRIG